MGVSIEQYRQQIGIYNSHVKKTSASKIKSTGRKYSSYRNIFILCTFICLLTSLVIAATCNPYSPCTGVTPSTPARQSYMHTTTRPVYSLPSVKLAAGGKCYENCENYRHGYLGSGRVKLTKFVISYLEIEEVGYTYLAWNCDKGYLAQKKLDDVKIAAGKYSPPSHWCF